MDAADPWTIAEWHQRVRVREDSWHLPDHVRHIRVRRLNGELLEVSLTAQEANKIELIRDLKECLAKNDPCVLERPFLICCVRLTHMEMEIKDEKPVNWKWLEEGSVQYIVADVMSLPSDTLPNKDEMVLCCKDVRKLFDSKLLIIHTFQICKERGQVFCEEIFTAWTSAVRSLSHEEVNDCQRPCGKTVLNRCLSLLQALDEADELICAEDPEAFFNSRVDDFYDKRFPVHPFQDDGLDAFLLRTVASMTIELVSLKLTRQTVEASFPHPSEALKAGLWKMVRGEKCHTRGCNRCTGVFHLCAHLGLGVDLLMALINKGLPRWCWAGHLSPFNDSLLQHVLEPNPKAWNPREDAEGELCMFLAHKLSLQELCHLNEDGKVALSYAEEYLERHGRHQDGPWIEVPRVIKQQMEEKVRHFEGSLIELMELARLVRAGLRGEVDGLESLPAFEEQMWQRAGNIRQEWLRMGWRFAADSTNGQISEVLSWHFEAVGRGIRHR